MQRGIVNYSSDSPAQRRDHNHEWLLLGKQFWQSLAPSASVATECMGPRFRGDNADVALHRRFPSRDAGNERLRAVTGGYGRSLVYTRLTLSLFWF